MSEYETFKKWVNSFDEKIYYKIKPLTKKELYETAIKQEEEIERLKKGYCPIKEKCNKGECDCTNEEYNQMCEENMKLDLEIERLTAESTKWESKFYDEAKKIDSAIEYLENIPRVLTRTDVIYLLMILKRNDIVLGVLKALNEDLLEDDVPMG